MAIPEHNRFQIVHFLILKHLFCARWRIQLRPKNQPCVLEKDSNNQIEQGKRNSFACEKYNELFLICQEFY